MTQAEPVRPFTIAEYYAMERSADPKSDYYRGEIFAMADGSPRHSLICNNVGGEIRSRLKSGPCITYQSDLRLKTKSTGLRNYPDVSVYCDAIEFDDEDAYRETATNPTVIVEVLSPTTEAYDRGLKSVGYRQIESLQALILISQQLPHVEIYERHSGGSWSFREVTDLSDSVSIASLGITLPLAEIYARVQFDKL